MPRRSMKMAALLPCMLGCVLAFGGGPVAAGEAAEQADATARLEQLFEDEWRDRLVREPLLASQMGVRRHDHLLADVSAEAQRRNLARDRGYLARLEGIDRDQLTAENRLNQDLFRFILGHRVRLAGHRLHRMPLISDSGFHTVLQRMHDAMPFKTVADYERYLSRLRALGRHFDQQIENMRAGVAEGLTQPREILDAMLPSIASGVVEDPRESPYFTPFRSLPAQFGEAEAARLEAAGEAAVAEVAIPAHRRLLQFFTEEYMPGARVSLGASALENGRALYEDLVYFYTTLDDATPDAIHELGLKEVARIRKEMEQIIAQTGFAGSFAEFLEFLRTDPRFYVDQPQQLLKEASYIAKQIDGQMPAFFRTLPRQPYGLQPVPDAIAENYTAGRYWPAPAGARRGGYYMLNIHSPEKRPLYGLVALTLHEGVPGHHHQLALRQENQALPPFRRAFYPHAFGEGWGLYAEKLGVEMNIYKTPYEHFGRLTYEMWRAARLVVDTGIHWKGWSRQQARDFMAENSALSLRNVHTEVDRYVAWPGQALAYKMGELKLLELRARAEQALGEKFDIRDFHDAVLLTGGLPLGLLDAEIDRFIAQTLSKDGSNVSNSPAGRGSAGGLVKHAG